MMPRIVDTIPKMGRLLTQGKMNSCRPPAKRAIIHLTWTTWTRSTCTEKEYLIYQIRTACKILLNLRSRIKCLPCHSVILLKTYFEMMDAFSPIIDKTDFIIRYQSGNCSLFLLYAILAVSASYAPQETISACGFTARSDAQTTFATRATLLYDFQFDNELLPVLQGALLLTKIIPDKPIDKDSNYWYYTAMRLATKLEIYNQYARRSLTLPRDY